MTRADAAYERLKRKVIRRHKWARLFNWVLG